LISLAVLVGLTCLTANALLDRLVSQQALGFNPNVFHPYLQADWKSEPAFERNLRDFVTIARAKEMLVLLATQPSLYREDLTPAERQLLGFPLSHYFDGQRPSLRSMIEGMKRSNDVTRRLARETGVELVDLERQMPKTTQYLYDDVHYTRAGNELIGNAFADRIVQSKIIELVMEARAKGESYDPAPPTTFARRQ